MACKGSQGFNRMTRLRRLSSVSSTYINKFSSESTGPIEIKSYVESMRYGNIIWFIKSGPPCPYIVKPVKTYQADILLKVFPINKLLKTIIDGSEQPVLFRPSHMPLLNFIILWQIQLIRPFTNYRLCSIELPPILDFQENG